MHIFKGHIKEFTGTQTVMNYVLNFFGREDGKPIEVSTGVHLYNFTCLIPTNAPSSYEGTHGKVRYRVKVLLDLPIMPDIIYEMPFIVIRIENLNNLPWLRRKIEIEEEHAVGIFCCESLPLIVSIRIQQSGYALGETINMKIEACNQGPSKFKPAQVALERIEICNSQAPEQETIKTKKIVTYRTSKPILQFESIFYDECLMIPEEMPVTSSENSDIFQVCYQVKYSTMSNKNLINNRIEVCVPITIAHRPFDPEPVKPTYDDQSTPIEELRKLSMNLIVKVIIKLINFICCYSVRPTTLKTATTAMNVRLLSAVPSI